MQKPTTETEIRSIFFEQRLTLQQVPFFRGAVVGALSLDNELLHNHTAEGLRYSYPMVQYKSIGAKAAIVAIGNESVSLFRELRRGETLNLAIGNEPVKPFVVTKVTSEWADFSTGEEPMEYSLSSWLPLNQRNYAQYLACESIAEKALMLQSILTGNILSAAKGVGEHIDNRIKCNITWLEEPRLKSMKDVKMMAFNLRFKANIILPDNIGLGKGASRGFGNIMNL